jgi:hypothetical protein
VLGPASSSASEVCALNPLALLGRRVQFTDLTTFGFLSGEFGHVERYTRGSCNREAFYTVLVDSPHKELGYPDRLAGVLPLRVQRGRASADARDGACKVCLFRTVIR